MTDQPIGYLEPVPEVYRRLESLVQAERGILKETGYLTPDLAQRLDTFSALLSMIRRLEAKQRSGRNFNAAEIEQLRFFGGFLEHLTVITRQGGQSSMEDDDMAVIADVSSAYSTALKKQLALEEGVGHALPIYVAVQRNRHRVLTRGAVFTYYEFTHPAEDRLTDEKWRQILGTKEAQPCRTGPGALSPASIHRINSSGRGLERHIAPCVSSPITDACLRLAAWWYICMVDE